MLWGCWVELEDKDVHCKGWECIIESFTEEEADTTVHQIYGQRATLSVNYKPGDWESVRAWILSGIRLASGRNSRGSAKMMMIAFITFKSSLVPLFDGL